MISKEEEGKEEKKETLIPELPNELWAMILRYRHWAIFNHIRDLPQGEKKRACLAELEEKTHMIRAALDEYTHKPRVEVMRHWYFDLVKRRNPSEESGRGKYWVYEAFYCEGPGHFMFNQSKCSEGCIRIEYDWEPQLILKQAIWKRGGNPYTMKRFRDEIFDDWNGEPIMLCPGHLKKYYWYNVNSTLREINRYYKERARKKKNRNKNRRRKRSRGVKNGFASTTA